MKRAVLQNSSTAPVPILGVDDWAWRKGQRFGTILVDLERRRVVDLLPDRSADSLATWFRGHPEVNVIRRDRQGLYAEGARRGAPQAVQVADRFHLLRNRIQAVEEQLDTMPAAMRLDSAAVGAASELPQAVALTEVVEQTPSLLRTSRLYLVQGRFAQVMTLHRDGLNEQPMMRLTGVGRRRVETWTRLEHLPKRQGVRPRAGMPEAFRDYLSQRWQQGCHSVMQLLSEIRPQGYRGGYSGLARLLAGWRTSLHYPSPLPVVRVPLPADSRRRWSPRSWRSIPGNSRNGRTILSRGSERTVLKSDSSAASYGDSRRCRAVPPRSSYSNGSQALTAAATLRSRLAAGSSGRRKRGYHALSNGQVQGQANRLKALKRQR